MKWIGITGSWRKSCPALEADLDREIGKILQEGNGIITGGALGVDYKATKLSLGHSPDGSRIKVILPTTLNRYINHYRKRASEGVITVEQAENLIKQLNLIYRLGALRENSKQLEVNEKAYYLRNTEVVKASDELLAFQVNKSAGTMDTINKAHDKAMPLKVFNYTVE